MSRIVDARGQACPQPVILARHVMQQGLPVTVIVDNDTAQHNVTRMAEKAGYTVSVEERGDGIYLTITGDDSPQPSPAAPQPGVPAGGPLVIAFPADQMGRGDAELGAILVRGFCHALTETEPRPDSLIFFNSGVKLVIEGSPVLADLQLLQQRGVEILACGTCLDFFGLKDRLAVGEVSNMYTIVETLANAGKLVSI